MTIGAWTILTFGFRAIQLNRLRWQDFRDIENPVAAALMAEMGVELRDRVKVKWICYRILVKLKLAPAKTELLSGFIDAYLNLNAREKVELQAHIEAAEPQEREIIMALTNSWIEQGRQEGKQREANLVIRLLTKRLGTLSPERATAIQGLPLDQLESLAEAIFEIDQDADLAPWLG